MSNLTGLFVLLSPLVLLSGCGQSESLPPIDEHDDLGNFDEYFDDETKEAARLEKEQQQIRREQEALEEQIWRADQEQQGHRRTTDQRRREELCVQLLGDLRADLRISPSATVKELLGPNFSVELRDGPNPIPLDKLTAAIAHKKWFDVISLLTRRRVSEYPDEVSLDGIRRDFLTHEFVAFIRTTADLSRVHVISLSESRPVVSSTAGVSAYDYVCVNGKTVRCQGGYAEPYFRCERHPDGVGWFFNWQPIHGEIILVPNLGDVIRAELGGLRKLHSNDAMKSVQKNGPVLTGFIASLRTQIAPSVAASESFSWWDTYGSPEISEGEIRAQLGRIGPILWELKNGTEAGLVPLLKRKLELGELTPERISEELDKACLERFKAKQSAALAM